MNSKHAEHQTAHRNESSIQPAKLLSKSTIERSVVNERFRADRRSVPFVTLEFRLLTASTRTSLQRRRLIRLIQQRMRVTDKLGGLENNRLLLLLADTDRAGAERLREEILRLAEAKDVRLIAKIEVYPPDEQSKGRHLWQKLGTQNVRSNGRRCESDPYRSEGSPVSSSIPAWKRAMDVSVAIVMLVVLSPVLLAVAIVIKLTSPGEVLFRQWRDGQGGQPFLIYKFRTMRTGAETEQAQLRGRNEQDGPAFKIDRDPRVTTFGRFLRVSCIDELPQLINVLRGEMSLVGPRPLPCTESRQIQSWQARRMSVRPGLTCHWQALRTTEMSFTDWMRLDLRYVDQIRLTTDLALIGQTAAAILGWKKAPR